MDANETDSDATERDCQTPPGEQLEDRLCVEYALMSGSPQKREFRAKYAGNRLLEQRIIQIDELMKYRKGLAKILNW